MSVEGNPFEDYSGLELPSSCGARGKGSNSPPSANRPGCGQRTDGNVRNARPPASDATTAIAVTATLGSHIR